ncbi:DUF2259 domain-containing protein [Borreliella americana]|uniref:DUF2259 domain-containing protein n=1 Tax=Borreliella americana TaxID=478807 RepID=UPI001E52B488|nr:DUF2259 domain-containing protein [Borreliella americana]MCD2331833.1 DUF2259 domain-containing protein [Borreliella americana]MCD2349081.1 DUF2259 domain-containing protein [Borreliella americana]MCD2381814.1 DUF2259 domain-containing protein [Borreliella americana]
MIKLYVVFFYFFSFLLGFPENIFFKNLGFSNNDRYFMFGEYGFENGHYYSAAYFVDVVKNNFANSGVHSKIFKEYIEYSDSYDKSLYELLKIINFKVKEFKINHLRRGREIYFYVNSEIPETDFLNFVDFKTGNEYQVFVNKDINSQELSSSFNIFLSIRYCNSFLEKHLIVGRGNYYRKNVIDYRIREIVLFPNEDGIVFVLEKIMLNSYGNKYKRFMVEVKKY